MLGIPELAEAFPDYAFSDMISFSVYGLVSAKLSAS
jgi:hypothetical protein